MDCKSANQWVKKCRELKDFIIIFIVHFIWQFEELFYPYIDCDTLPDWLWVSSLFTHTELVSLWVRTHNQDTTWSMCRWRTRCTTHILIMGCTCGRSQWPLCLPSQALGAAFPMSRLFIYLSSWFSSPLSQAERRMETSVSKLATRRCRRWTPILPMPCVCWDSLQALRLSTG